MFPAPSLKLDVVVNDVDTLYISPADALDNAGKLANVTVPIGLRPPFNDSDTALACSA